MIPIEYFAGFQPKDLMFFLYLPAIGLVTLASIIILIIKRRGHPYVLLPLIYPIIAITWYFFDRTTGNRPDRSQTILLIGLISVFGVYAVASSKIVPNTSGAVNLFAVIATVFGAAFTIYAFRERNK